MEQRAVEAVRVAAVEPVVAEEQAAAVERAAELEEAARDGFIHIAKHHICRSCAFLPNSA